MIYPELKDNHVVVTGGANGIGEAMVRAFHAQGAYVFFGDRDARAGQTLARELGGRAVFANVDLNQEQSIRSWIGGIGRSHRRIHALINNAARDPRIPLKATTAAQWDSLFATNLRAYFLASREAVRWMKPAAAIINLASITFHHGPANMTAYVATKGGVIGFTRSLARELGPKRIRVNTISPGWIMTERQLRQFVTPATRRLIRQSQCIPDLLQPEEIADVALFLASNGSRGMTGQELLVDRGWQHS